MKPIWAIVFLVMALISAGFGFGGFLPELHAGLAQVLFVVFLVLFVAALLFSDTRYDGGC